MKKQVILCWAAWYPNKYSSDAIFIKKHLNLLSSNYDITLLHINFNSHHLFKRVKKNNGNFDEIIYYTLNNKIIKFISLTLLPFFEAIIMAFHKNSFGVLHIHVTYPLAAFTTLLDYLPFKKRVFTEHWTGFYENDGRFNKLNPWLKNKIRKNILNMDSGSYVSQSLATKMKDLGLYAKNNFITYNIISIDKDISDVAKTSYFSFCSLSRLDNNHKNQLDMIESFKLFNKKFKKSKLHIYGDGPDKDLLYKKVHDEKMMYNVIFEGEISNDQVYKAYQRHHVFLLTSNYESFSIGLAEALLNGMPSIVTKCGGPEEYIDIENGILVTLKNPVEWSIAMENIYINYDKYDSKKIISKMEKYTDYNKIKEQFNQLYKI